MHSVVRLHDASGNLGGGVDLEPNLRLFAVVDGNALKDERSESGTGTTSNSVVDNESLHVLRVVDELAETVVHLIEDLFTDSVVATGKVVGSVFLAIKQELRVEHLGIFASADIIHDSGLEIDSDVTGHKLPSSSLLEKGREILARVFVNLVL